MTDPKLQTLAPVSPITPLPQVAEEPVGPQAPQTASTQIQQPFSQDEDQRPGTATQVLSQALLSEDQPIQVQYGSTGKEQEAFANSQEWELPSSISAIEYEPVPEVSPEVEKYVTAVQDDPSDFPQEVVIADNSVSSGVQPHYVAKPVIVLPMTKAELEEGLKQSNEKSARWFAEWANKIWKMFSGEVVYQDDAKLSNQH